MCIDIFVSSFCTWDILGFPAFSHRAFRGGDRGIAGGGDLKHLRAGRLLLPGELHRERLSLRPPWLGHAGSQMSCSKWRRKGWKDGKHGRWDFLFDLRSTMHCSFLEENAEVHRFNGWIFGRRWYKIQLQQNMFREVSATGLGMENTEVAGCNKS